MTSAAAPVGPVVGYVPGAFDLFHVGHLNALRQARERCDVLVAGVVSDEMCELTKGARPWVPLEERLAIVDAIGIVDATYAEQTRTSSTPGARSASTGSSRVTTGSGLGRVQRSSAWSRPWEPRSSTSPTPCTPRARCSDVR